MQKEHPLTTWRRSQKEPMTQDDLAEALGISRWLVNRLENGKKTPSFHLAMRIEALTDKAVTARDFAPATSEAA